MTAVQLPEKTRCSILRLVFIFSAAIANNHKLGSFKQYPFIMLVSVDQKFQCASELVSWFRVSGDGHQGVGRDDVSFLEAQGIHLLPAHSKFGTVQFLAVWDCFLAGCQLGVPSLQRPLWSLREAPTFPEAAMARSNHWTLLIGLSLTSLLSFSCLPLLPHLSSTFSQRMFSAFKGLCDQTGSTDNLGKPPYFKV